MYYGRLFQVYKPVKITLFICNKAIEMVYQTLYVTKYLRYLLSPCIIRISMDI